MPLMPLMGVPEGYVIHLSVHLERYARRRDSTNRGWRTLPAGGLAVLIRYQPVFATAALRAGPEPVGKGLNPALSP